MKILTTAKIKNYKEIDSLIDMTINSFYKRHFYPIIYHAFGSRDDMKQCAWVRLLEVNKTRKILETGARGNKGMLVTIIKRGFIDYMRTRVGSKYGRNDGKSKYDPKTTGLLATTNYMDYYENEEGGFVDFDIADKRYTESNITEALLKKQLTEFLNSRLKPKDNMIMQLYREGHALKDIAAKMKLTESRISQIVNLITKQLEKDACRVGLRS